MAATTAYQAGADSNDLELAIAPEATWGTPPTGQYAKMRVNSENFSEQKNRSRPPEIRDDWQAAAQTTQDVQAKGGMQFGISYKNADDAIAGALTGEWSTPLAINAVAGDIEFAATGNKIKSVTAGKFTNVVAGQWLDVRGCSTNPDRMFLRVVTKVSAVELVVAGATLQNETPSGTAVKIRGSMLRNAKTFTSFSVQKRFSTGLGFIYPGTVFTGGQINASRGQFFSGQLDALCKSEEKAVAMVGTGFDPAPTNKVMNSVGHFQGFRIDDAAAAAKVMSLNTSFTRDGAAMAFAMGSESAQGLGSIGQIAVSGAMEVYFEDYDLYDSYKSEAPLLVSYRVVDTAGNAYIVTVPELVLGQSEIIAGGPNQPVMAKFNWGADPSAAYGCSLQIDRFDAVA